MKKRIGIVLVAVILCVSVFFWNRGTRAQVDEEAFSAIAGDYQAIESETLPSWWHLTIMADLEDPDFGQDYDYLFTLYDNAAGNPGVEGEIILLNAHELRIRINQDLFEQLPDGWKTDGNELILSYTAQNDQLILENSGVAAAFRAESYN